jgi:methionine--tRNA ligase beta chain
VPEVNSATPLFLILLHLKYKKVEFFQKFRYFNYMDKIIFDDFKKLDIRIGKVISAEKIENSDKLLKLQVDFGEQKLQIVSGIAEFYTPDSLVGKEFPFVINLEPRILWGVESQGMIMAASSDGKAVLLCPDREVLPGTIVK